MSNSTFLERLMTQSTIPDRHRRRRQATLAKNESKQALLSRTKHAAAAATLPVVTAKLPPQDFADNSVFTVHRPLPILQRDPQASMLQILFAATIGGTLAETLCGRSSTSSRPTNMFATIQSNGTVALQQDHHPTIALNQLRLSRVALAAGSASVLLSAKHYFDSNHVNNDTNILSSAAAGATMATVYTPWHNIRTYSTQTLFQTTSWLNATKTLLQTPQALFRHSTPIYAQHVTGAILFFGIYDALKPMKCEAVSRDSIWQTFGAGALAGMAYKSVLAGPGGSPYYSANSKNILGVVRAAPFYGVLFVSYESMLRLTSTS